MTARNFARSRWDDDGRAAVATMRDGADVTRVGGIGSFGAEDGAGRVAGGYGVHGGRGRRNARCGFVATS